MGWTTLRDAVRLSEVSRLAASALAELDQVALTALLEQVGEMVRGQAAVEPEPVAAVERSQEILGHVLTATEQNIQLLRRLKQREGGHAWEL